MYLGYVYWGTVIGRHGSFQLKRLGKISHTKGCDLCHETLNSGHRGVQKGSFINMWPVQWHRALLQTHPTFGLKFHCCHLEIFNNFWTNGIACKFCTRRHKWSCPEWGRAIHPTHWQESSYWATKLISTTYCKRGVVVRVLLVGDYFAKKGCAISWGSGF